MKFVIADAKITSDKEEMKSTDELRKYVLMFKIRAMVRMKSIPIAK